MQYLKNDFVKIGLILVAGCVLIYVITEYQNKQEQVAAEVQEQFQQQKQKQQQQVAASRPLGDNEIYQGVQAESGPELADNKYTKDCFPKDQLTPGELLPGDKNSKWAQVNPESQGGLGDQNFLNAGYHVGINTVGQTLRNANLQLRSEPPNPQVAVSPWSQSSIEPDTNRKPLEIGGC